MNLKRIIIYLIYKLYVIGTAKLNFTHYYILSRNIPIYKPTDKLGILGNLCYGNNKAVNRAMGENFDRNCMIEHGIYFGRYVIEEECIYPEISTIYTYGPYREEVLKDFFGPKFSKRIITVGPYIKYAKHLYTNKKLLQLKKKLGKVLLVFPSHSSPDTNVEFNYDIWLKEISERAKDFDTVIISMFWTDINKGLHKKYLGKGYIIACNGNRFDPHFLSRQKDLIYLSDMTMSNNIGTHVGYCICMNKPHYIFRQTVELNRMFLINNIHSVECNRAKEYDELYTIFSTFEQTITPEQISKVEYYWGKF